MLDIDVVSYHSQIFTNIHKYSLNAAIMLLTFMYGKKCKPRSVVYALTLWYAVTYWAYMKAHHNHEKIVENWSWNMNKRLIRGLEVFGLFGLGYITFRIQLRDSASFGKKNGLF